MKETCFEFVFLRVFTSFKIDNHIFAQVGGILEGYKFWVMSKAKQ